MLVRISYYLLVIFLYTLGLALSGPVLAADTVVPNVDRPDACWSGSMASQPCQRWYSLSEKSRPDACMGQPRTRKCGRWFSVRPPVVRAIVMKDVHFDFDSSRIKPESYPTLDREAARIKQDQYDRVTIVGHTDSQGTEQYNKKLSLERASAVMEYFMKQGISPSRMAVTGRGDTMPVADNSTKEGRAENRRTELYLN